MAQPPATPPTQPEDVPLQASDKRTVQQAVKDAWLSVLGVVTSAETELHKRTTRLLESLGEGTEELANEMMARMRKNTEEFERRIDEGVKSAVAAFRAPIDKELQQLRSRIEHLQARLDEQKSRRSKKD